MVACAFGRLVLDIGFSLYLLVVLEAAAATVAHSGWSLCVAAIGGECTTGDRGSGSACRLWACF